MGTQETVESVDVVVIGGGQAGLASGYYLRRMGVDFVILDASQRIGDSWRQRWDSLQLFTPARYDRLPGMPFPAAPDSFPTKDEMADYLEAYARQFALPVRSGAQVGRLWRTADRLVLACGGFGFQTSEVVVATGAHVTPLRPAWAGELDPAIVQLHARDYRNPAQLPAGPVLVVGAGNSGAEIAMETAAAGHITWLAGRPVGESPERAYAFGGRLFWFFANSVASRRHPLGRRIVSKLASRGGPLIRLRLKDVVAAGVGLVPRVTGVSSGRPVLADGRTLPPASIVWCTGFGQDFRWIDLPSLQEPGLHFIGMPFQHKLASALIGGVGSDAEQLARSIRATLSRRPPQGATTAGMVPSTPS
ncbi:MAG TPA: NAD(P)-binding domain-containing protein [Ktedonobacterales bacterium]|nr:NAD(P)-binding domain-containing protein [Ktedonobacterales bacterium]